MVSLPRVVIALVIAASGVLIAGARTAETQPGIVAEKPAAGRFVEADGRFMVPYTETIPGTTITFEMIPVAGGELLLGSPATEAGRSDDEGPQVRVSLPPYWVGKCEVTWAEYKAYMDMYTAFKALQQLSVATENGDRGTADEWALVRAHSRDGKKADANDLDGVTCPTPLYSPDQTYSAGDRPTQPAVTMTQFAARQYTKWLSGVTGRNYRLPSEVEWEYAARAGTTTAYSFGDDPAEFARYGWFADNANFELHDVGTKEPNPWGLHDMHGNVGEWTLDEYAADRYSELAKQNTAASGAMAAADAILWPTKLYPRVIRGGSWLEGADRSRSAARQASEEDDWKLSDPNYPHSPWWYTEEPALAVGMRVVRPLAPMTEAEQKRVWQADVDRVRKDVKMRLDEGRGALGFPDQALPEAIKAAEKLRE